MCSSKYTYSSKYTLYTLFFRFSSWDILVFLASIPKFKQSNVTLKTGLRRSNETKAHACNRKTLWSITFKFLEIGGRDHGSGGRDHGSNLFQGQYKKIIKNKRFIFLKFILPNSIFKTSFLIYGRALQN